MIEATEDRAISLGHLGRLDELDKLVDDTLAAHPDDLVMLFMRMDAAALKPFAS